MIRANCFFLIDIWIEILQVCNRVDSHPWRPSNATLMKRNFSFCSSVYKTDRW
jgi:hypothetical protein